MGTCKCKSICNPDKALGVVCGEKKARLSGMFCIPCKNNAIRLLNGNELSGEMRGELENLWARHLERAEDERLANNRHNHNHRTKDNGASKRKDQEAQNARRRAKRAGPRAQSG